MFNFICNDYNPIKIKTRSLSNFTVSYYQFFINIFLNVFIIVDYNVFYK